MANKKYIKFFYFFSFITTFFLVAVVGLWNGYNIGSESRNWDKTTGLIVSSQVVKKEETDAENLGVRIHYDFKVEYEYMVNKILFKNNTLSYKEQIRSKAESTIKRNQYPVDKKVPVYFNPKNPKQSVLETGAGIRFPIVFTSLFVFFISLSYFFWNKSYR